MIMSVYGVDGYFIGIAPRRMTPVANILVTVVPKRLARIPPIRGVHVLFKL